MEVLERSTKLKCVSFVVDLKTYSWIDYWGTSVSSYQMDTFTQGYLGPDVMMQESLAVTLIQSNWILVCFQAVVKFHIQ